MTSALEHLRVTDPEQLVDFYSDHPAAHIYALADLDEPYWSLSRWYRRADAVVGVVEFPNDEGHAVYAVATRDVPGTLDLLAQLAGGLPDGILLTGPVGLADALPGPVAWSGSYLRYELTSPERLPVPEATVVPLDREHLPALFELYETEPGAAFFAPHMITNGGCVGVFDGDRLVAAAAAHVLSERSRCAAIGAVYTHPDHRGRGLGAAVTAGVVRQVSARTDVIGLNVAESNRAARSVYEAIGFEPILSYEEAGLDDSSADGALDM